MEMKILLRFALQNPKKDWPEFFLSSSALLPGKSNSRSFPLYLSPFYGFPYSCWLKLGFRIVRESSERKKYFIHNWRVKDFNGVDFYLLKPHPFFSFPWPETVSSKFYLEFYVYLCSHWCARSLKNWGYFLWSFNLDSFSFPLAVLCFQFNRGRKFEEFDTQDLRFQEPKMYSWFIIWWFVTFLFLFFFSNSLFLFFC